MGLDEFKTKYDIRLNDQQDAAVESVDGAVLLLAVPGSGKTTVLISRLGYMILEKEICPDEILTVTYTVAAAEDMKRRFVETFGEVCTVKPEFRTINSFSQMILRYFEYTSGKTMFRLAESETAVIIRNILIEVTNQFPTDSDINDVKNSIAFVKNMRLTEEQIAEMDERIEYFSKIYVLYRQELRRQSLMDFDDQMVYALKILETYPHILDHFKKKYKYICMDEAQDTSKIQHDIVRLLAGKDGNIFMVGDEDQSIYGFRAAYPEALVSFEKTYDGAKVLFMEKNYRSVPQIVAAADKLISKNSIRHEKHMTASRTTQGKVKEISLKSRKSQYNYLLKIAAGCEVQTAVLYRNNECALPLIDLLERKEIPYLVKGKDMSFFSHPVVNDILDFIRFSIDPFNPEMFLKIYYKMGAGIRKETAETVTRKIETSKTFLEMIAEKADTTPYTVQKCRELNTHFRKMRDEDAGRAIFRILHSMGYKKYMENKGYDRGKAEILRILGEREEVLVEFPKRIERLNQIILTGNKEKNCKFILSTIHSSKGLEYDRVYLADMIEGILPSGPEIKGQMTKSEKLRLYEEERRLYYVGMTRAKTELNIFTFPNGIVSAFTKEVFYAGQSLTEKIERKRETMKTGPYRPVECKEVLTQETVQSILDKLTEGSSVQHNKFGRGIIIARNKDIAEIRFSNIADLKKISLSLAVRNKMLCLTE